MKKFVIYALCCMVCISCSVNEMPEENKASVFTAAFEDNGTKVYLNDTLQTRWNADDRISIFATTNNWQYRFDGQTGDRVGYFSRVDGSADSGEKLSANYAIYPYNPSSQITKSGIATVYLPYTQYYAEKSYGPGANTMVAATSSSLSYHLEFKTLCGFIVLRLYGEGTVESITLTGNNSEKIAGEATVSPEYGGLPKVNVTDSGAESIVLDCGEGVELSRDKNAPTQFWLCVPPVTFSKGFTVTVTSPEGRRMAQSTTTSRTIHRNVINKMEPLEVKFEDFQYYSIPESLLNGWHEGACTIRDNVVDDFLLIQKDTLTEQLLFYLNTEGKDVEEGFTLMFSKDSTDAYILSMLHHANKDYCAFYGEESLSIISFNNGEAEMFEVPYDDDFMQVTKASPSLQGTVRHYLNKKMIPNYISLFENLRSALNNDFGGLIKSLISDKLTNISGLKGWKALGLAKLYECVGEWAYDQLKTGFMGSADAMVTNVKRTDASTIAVTVELKNASTIPDELICELPDGGTGTIKNKVLLGVAAGMDNHPGYYLNRWQSGLYIVNKTSKSFVFYFNIPLSGIETYYFRPFLMPYASAMASDLMKSWMTCIRYGESEAYTDFVITLSNFKQTGCSKKGNDNYAVTFTVDGVIEGDVDLNGIDWGFRINDEWNDVMASGGQYIPPKSKNFQVELELQSEKMKEEIKLTPFVFFRNALPNYVFGEPITEIINFFDVETGEATNITSNSAVVSGSYEGLFEGCRYGIDSWSNSSSYTIYGDDILGAEKLSAKFALKDLKPNTEYHYCAVIEYDGQVIEGETRTFTTGNFQVETGGATDVTNNSAVVSGSYEGLFEGCRYGIDFWSNSSAYTIYGDDNFGQDKFSEEFALKDLEPNTEYHYCAVIEYDGQVIEGEAKTFTTKSGEGCPDASHVHAIDLGLSVKWACCNVGASSPEEYGGLYAWGETETKSEYTYRNYRYSIYDSDGYCIGYENLGSDISGTQYDVAHVRWGGKWRMPTIAEFEELINNCTSTWTDNYDGTGVSGRIFTSNKNGNSIFLPAAGDGLSGGLYGAGSYGIYWSSTFYGGYGSYAWDLYFCSVSVLTNYGPRRRYGQSVRPVTE